ncbi:unnamed protein product [Peronospora belbahrii]|uniref:Uncharacterized protein n=1 Tax=Peronospora belbahrii TaxID=622444 RepID=A0AAU9KSM5_9STRA|nr:unnamed protein product [Peronospora belbahrii]
MLGFIDLRLTKYQVPRAQSFVSVGSRRYLEWYNLVYESTTDQVDYHEDMTEKDEGPLVEVLRYSTPSRILQRPRILVPVRTMAFQLKVDRGRTPGRSVWAKDVNQGWAIIPEIDLSPTSIKLEDIQIPDSDGNTPEEVDRLRQILWRRRHLLMEKGNALPLAARDAICDIDVGNARPIAQRVRKVAPQFKEKLAYLI